MTIHKHPFLHITKMQQKQVFNSVYMNMKYCTKKKQKVMFYITQMINRKNIALLAVTWINIRMSVDWCQSVSSNTPYQAQSLAFG